MDSIPTPMLILGGIVLVALLFFVLRAVVLWYFKIDQRIELMQDQKALLNKIAEALEVRKDLNPNS